MEVKKILNGDQFTILFALDSPKDFYAIESSKFEQIQQVYCPGGRTFSEDVVLLVNVINSIDDGDGIILEVTNKVVKYPMKNLDSFTRFEH